MSKIYQFNNFKYMDILQKEISYFLLLCEHLNISKAAEIQGIQQSGLSRALNRLESDIGQKLFIRKNNGLVLTGSGQQFLEAVRNTKNSWENNFKKIIQNTDEPTGLIKIGLHSSFGQNYFPQIVKNLSATYPQIEVEAHMLSSNHVVRMTNEQELDFGIVISNIKNPNLIQKKIGSDFIAAYHSKDLSNIKKMEKILFNPEMRNSLPVLKKYTNNKKIFIKDYEIMAKTAQNGPFVAILPQSVAQNYKNLVQISSAFLRADISLVTHIEKLQARSFKLVFDQILLACVT